MMLREKKTSKIFKFWTQPSWDQIWIEAGPAGLSGFIHQYFLNLLLANWHQIQADSTPIYSVFSKISLIGTIRFNKDFRAGLLPDGHGFDTPLVSLLVNFIIQISH